MPAPEVTRAREAILEYRISDKRLSPESMAFFTEANKYRGLIPTGELLLAFEDSGSCAGECLWALAVFKGRRTGYDTVRDCGDHYIIARYDRFDRIDKATMKVTKDVPDR